MTFLALSIFVPPPRPPPSRTICLCLWAMARLPFVLNLCISFGSAGFVALCLPSVLSFESNCLAAICPLPLHLICERWLGCRLSSPIPCPCHLWAWTSMPFVFSHVLSFESGCLAAICLLPVHLICERWLSCRLSSALPFRCHLWAWTSMPFVFSLFYHLRAIAWLPFVLSLYISFVSAGLVAVCHLLSPFDVICEHRLRCHLSFPCSIIWERLLGCHLYSPCTSHLSALVWLPFVICYPQSISWAWTFVFSLFHHLWAIAWLPFVLSLWILFVSDGLVSIILSLSSHLWAMALLLFVLSLPSHLWAICEQWFGC
jgi:hypothetical protein